MYLVSYAFFVEREAGDAFLPVVNLLLDKRCKVADKLACVRNGGENMGEGKFCMGTTRHKEGEEEENVCCP